MNQFLSRRVDAAGVAHQLNRWVSAAQRNELSVEEVANRIVTCLPDVSQELAVKMVETDGVFLDNPDGRIGLYPGGTNQCAESTTLPQSNGSST